MKETFSRFPIGLSPGQVRFASVSSTTIDVRVRGVVGVGEGSRPCVSVGAEALEESREHRPMVGHRRVLLGLGRSLAPVVLVPVRIVVEGQMRHGARRPRRPAAPRDSPRASSRRRRRDGVVRDSGRPAAETWNVSVPSGRKPGIRAREGDEGPDEKPRAHEKEEPESHLDEHEDPLRPGASRRAKPSRGRPPGERARGPAARPRRPERARR